MKKQSSPWGWIQITLLTTIILHPLLGQPIRGHDFNLHFYRIPIINAMWEQGIWFSRWSPDLTLGYGSPLFNFYPPLSAYLLTITYWLTGQHAPLAYNLSYALALITGTSGMFLLGRWLYGPTGGLLASAAYTFSPLLLYQTYARGSLSNSWVLALLPWAAWALLTLVRQPQIGKAILTIILLASLPLFHIAAGLIQLPALLLLALAGLTPWKKIHTPPRLGSTLLILGGVLLGGLALSAFFWLPAIIEISYTYYAQAANEVVFADHFAAVWHWPARHLAGAINPDWPLSPGIGQMIIAFGAGVVAWGTWLTYTRQDTPDNPPQEQALLATRVAAFSLLLGSAGLFLATAPSYWLWENIPLLTNWQFPWRFLDLPTFFFALTSGYAAYRLQEMSQRPYRKQLSFLLLGGAITLFFVNAIPYLYPPVVTDLPQRLTPADATYAQQRYAIYGLIGWSEYTASTVTAWPSEPLFEGADNQAPLAAKTITPDLPAQIIASDPWQATWQFDAPSATEVTLAHHYFPGWQLTVNGQAAPLAPDELGRIQFTVPAGDHLVTLAWGQTPVRRWANGFSTIAILLLLALAFYQLYRGQRTAKPEEMPLASQAQSSSGSRGWRWFTLLPLFLLLFKVGWLDHYPSPWLMHPAPDGTVAGLATPASSNFADQIQLLGYEFAEPDQLTLYWQAQRTLDEVYSVNVYLRDARGVPLHTEQNATPGLSSTNSWQAGQVIRDTYRLPLDEALAPIGYRVSVGVQGADGKPLPVVDGAEGSTATRVRLGQTQLAEVEVVIPASAQVVGAEFGGAIALTHAVWPAVVERGQPFDLTLYWESITAVSENYTVFVHLYDQDGTLLAGNDGPPREGLYPTSYWVPGETIVGERSWLLDLPPGEYPLHVGLYELESGQRLPITTADAPPADSVQIGYLTIE